MMTHMKLAWTMTRTLRFLEIERHQSAKNRRLFFLLLLKVKRDAAVAVMAWWQMIEMVQW